MAEPVKIRVIGIGDFGKNAINVMKNSDLKEVEYSVLDDNNNPYVLKANIVTALPVPTEMVFIITNTEETDMNIASRVAETTREMDILSVVLVVKSSSSDNAENKTEKLKESADSVMVISEDEFVNESLLQRIKTITDLINIPGLINVEFADVECVLKNSGLAQTGFGDAKKENRYEKAAKMALNSLPDISNSTGLILNIVGGSDMALYEVSEIVNIVNDVIKEDTQIVVGAIIDENILGSIQVTIIAAGLDNKKQVI